MDVFLKSKGEISVYIRLKNPLPLPGGANFFSLNGKCFFQRKAPVQRTGAGALYLYVDKGNAAKADIAIHMKDSDCGFIRISRDLHGTESGIVVRLYTESAGNQQLQLPERAFQINAAILPEDFALLQIHGHGTEGYLGLAAGKPGELDQILIMAEGCAAQETVVFITAFVDQRLPTVHYMEAALLWLAQSFHQKTETKQQKIHRQENSTVHRYGENFTVQKVSAKQGTAQT